MSDQYDDLAALQMLIDKAKQADIVKLATDPAKEWPCQCRPTVICNGCVINALIEEVVRLRGVIEEMEDESASRGIERDLQS